MLLNFRLACPKIFWQSSSMQFLRTWLIMLVHRKRRRGDGQVRTGYERRHEWHQDNTWQNLTDWQNYRFPEKRALGLLQDQLHCWYWSCRPTRVCHTLDLQGAGIVVWCSMNMHEQHQWLANCLTDIHQYSFDFPDCSGNSRISLRSVKFVLFSSILDHFGIFWQLQSCIAVPSSYA